MSSFKIIKSAEVQDNSLQVLPLRRSTAADELAQKRTDSPSDLSVNLQAWARAQAEETISRARFTADEIIRQTHVDIEQVRKLAYRGGYDQGCRDGFEKGYQDGIIKAEEESQAIREQAASFFDQVENIRRKTLQALEQEVVELAVEIAERLVSAQLELDPSTVLKIAAESIRLVAERLNVVLYVSPSEMEYVNSKKTELKSILPARAELQVVADSSILPGGCKIETEQGWVDATIEARREALVKALYGSER